MAKFSGAGLLTGLISGARLGLDIQESQRRGETDKLRRQELELGLENARRDQALRRERDRFVDDSTLEPMYEDASGNIPMRQHKEMSLGEQISFFKRLGELDFKAGKMSQADFMALPAKLRAYETEGVLDALNVMEETSDPQAGIDAFNKLGTRKIKGYQPRQTVDPATGMKVTEFLIRTDDDKYITMNPLQLARDAGGLKGWQEMQRTHLAGRKVAAEERRAGALEEGVLQRGERTDREMDLRERGLWGSRSPSWVNGREPAAIRVRENRIKDLMSTGMSRTEAVRTIEGGSLRMSDIEKMAATRVRIANQAKKDDPRVKVPTHSQAKQQIAAEWGISLEDLRPGRDPGNPSPEPAPAGGGNHRRPLGEY